MSGSWQSYVDDQMVGGGGLASAIIIGNSDGKAWATSSGFSLKPGEGAAIVNLFKSPANVFASGVTVNGTQDLGIKGDDRSIYGRKGATGTVLVKTSQTILIGVYNDTVQSAMRRMSGRNSLIT